MCLKDDICDVVGRRPQKSAGGLANVTQPQPMTPNDALRGAASSRDGLEILYPVQAAGEAIRSILRLESSLVLGVTPVDEVEDVAINSSFGHRSPARRSVMVVGFVGECRSGTPPRRRPVHPAVRACRFIPVLPRL